MGTINNIFSPFFSTNNTPSSGALPTLSPTVPSGYGEAFSLTLTQQVGDGSDSDMVTLSGSGQEANGDGVAFVSESTGTSAESAYESMMASISGFGDIGDMGVGGSSSGPYTSPLDPLFNQLSKMLGNNSGTVSGGMMELTLNPASASGASSASGTGSSSAPSETLSQFVDTLVTSLEGSLSSSVAGVANNTIA